MGLVLLLFSHIFTLYYLLWILLDYIDPYSKNYSSTLRFLSPVAIHIQPYFPSQKYRIILPTLLFGPLFLYLGFVYIMRRVKLNQMAASNPFPTNGIYNCQSQHKDLYK